jgi:predicted Zn-dependent protease with MMP-like domain
MENDEDDDLPRLEMSAQEFEALAREVVSELPQEFQDQPYAPDDLLEQMEVPEDEDLFGLYEGAALTERSVSDAPLLPPRIRLFYEAILDDCYTLDDVREEVRTTLLHEIGHHFGMDEEDLDRLGYG